MGKQIVICLQIVIPIVESYSAIKIIMDICDNMNEPQSNYAT